MSAVKSAERTLLVIELLTRHPGGLTFLDIIEQLDLPKSSAHALLQTMLQRGHLEFSETTKRFRLGVRLWEAGQAYDRAFDLARLARPFLEAARDELQETVQLAVLDGTDNVYIAKVDADQRLVLASNVGMRLPAHATGLGKVLLAGLDDEEIRARYDGMQLERFTPTTITDLDGLIDAVGAARVRGYAVDEAEYTHGVRCVAVPIVGPGRTVTAAVSVSVPEVRLPDDAVERVAACLVKHAGELTSSLGWDRAGLGRAMAVPPAG